MIYTLIMRSRGIFFIMAITTFIIYGCSAKIASFKNELTGADVVRMTGNKLTRENGFGRIELNAQRYEKNGSLSYSLIIVLAGPTYLTIEQGQTLFIEIDGIRTGVIGKGSGRHRNFLSPGLVEETAYYHDVDPGLISSIANAKNVRVEVHGSQRTIPCNFSKINFDNFKAFLFKCGEKNKLLGTRTIQEGN